MARQIADELTQILSGARDALLALPESKVGASRGEGAWIKRQILGHLIDSTAANHRRLVRAQFTDELRFPPIASLQRRRAAVPPRPNDRRLRPATRSESRMLGER